MFQESLSFPGKDGRKEWVSVFFWKHSFVSCHEGKCDNGML